MYRIRIPLVRGEATGGGPTANRFNLVRFFFWRDNKEWIKEQLYFIKSFVWCSKFSYLFLWSDPLCIERKYGLFGVSVVISMKQKQEYDSSSNSIKYKAKLTWWLVTRLSRCIAGILERELAPIHVGISEDGGRDFVCANSLDAGFVLHE